MPIVRKFMLRPYPYLCIALIGVSLKFYHLDLKLFWLDEIYTIQHTSGIPDREYPALIPAHEIKNIGYYRDLYRLNKHDYAISSQLKGLLTATQLNPLHYPFLMVWYRIVGDDPVHYRLFSVFIFIVTLPFVFLLSKTLFDSKLAGWVTASLYAVSPYIHLFAQEARYYILWSFVIIALHYVFLQAIRRDRMKWWLAYSFVAALSLYASPVSITILFGHIAFAGLTRKALIKRYCISISAAFLAYLPWVLSLFLKLDKVASALSWQANNEYHVAFWLPLLGQVFFLFSIFSAKLDFFSAFSRASFSLPSGAISAFVFNTLVLTMIVAALIFLFKYTRKEIKYFLPLIIIPGFLLFYILDVLRNGMTSWWWRYLIFIAPGLILMMTNFLYKKIENGNLVFFVCYLALVFIGISSIGSIAGARHWFIGNTMNVYIEDARFISKAERPLLITDFVDNKRMADFMVVVQECRSDSIDIFRASPGIDNIEERIHHKEYSNIYVLYASEALIGNLKSQFGGKMITPNVQGISSLREIILEKKSAQKGFELDEVEYWIYK